MRRRIIVSGVIAGVPDQGGAAWAVLQWVLGLRRLGHDAVLVEQVAADRFAAIAPRFTGLAERFGLGGASALIDDRGARTAGLSATELAHAVQGADLLLNLSGSLTYPALLEAAEVRAFVDLDPAFTQLWHTQGVDLGLDDHDAFVTVGRRLGHDGCSIPTCGKEWLTTAQPIVLEHWPVAEQDHQRGLTTIGHWRSYGSIHHDGVHYGQKAHSLRGLLELPELEAGPFELALAIDPDEHDDLEALRGRGWRLIDPRAVAATPSDYRDFVGDSWAELGVAKLGYAVSRCGWFSDRSVCYLASGRPVVAQDTGFGDWLETGEGLFAFQTAEQAAAAIGELRSDYPRHRRAARELAETVFDSDHVLVELLECL